MADQLRTYVYVDGFNLYYRALRRTPFKWLNLHALSQSLLGPDHEIAHIRYFTAPVSGNPDPQQPIRQQCYLRALQSLPAITIHLGNFLISKRWRPLVNPAPEGPTRVQIWNSEERGSDVNLATYLIHDAWRGLFDEALVFSQDTDLNEPVRLVRDEIKKPVGVVVLDGKEPGGLAQCGSFVRQLTPGRLAAAQFPDFVSFGRKGKQVRCPTEWLKTEREWNTLILPASFFETPASISLWRAMPSENRGRHSIMAITRWDPFRDVLGLRNSMNLLQELARQTGSSRGDADTLTAGSFVPPVDIYEEQDKIVLTLEVPGMQGDAFDISVEHNTLFVRGERQWANDQKEENYHRIERRYGSFSRSFTLPQTVDTQDVEASYDAGVLRIELKKRAESKSRQIKVQLGAPQQPTAQILNASATDASATRTPQPVAHAPERKAS